MAHGAVLLKEDSSLRDVASQRDLSGGLGTGAKIGKNDAQDKRAGE
jgi:hypothetical protein